MNGPQLFLEARDAKPLSDPIRISSRVKYTALDVSKHYMCLGSSSGSLYLFNKSDLRFLRVVSSNSDEQVVQISLSPDEEYVAYATRDGKVFIAQLNLVRSGLVRRHVWGIMGKINSGTRNICWAGRGRDERVLITALRWVDSSKSVYCGDNKGRVFQLAIPSILTPLCLRMPTQLVLPVSRDGASVVQLDWHNKRLLISTTSAIYICDTTRYCYTTVAQQPRSGHYGSCFFPLHESKIKDTDRNKNDHTVPSSDDIVIHSTNDDRRKSFGDFSDSSETEILNSVADEGPENWDKVYQESNSSESNSEAAVQNSKVENAKGKPSDKFKSNMIATDFHQETYNGNAELSSLSDESDGDNSESGSESEKLKNCSGYPEVLICCTGPGSTLLEADIHGSVLYNHRLKDLSKKSSTRNLEVKEYSNSSNQASSDQSNEDEFMKLLVYRNRYLLTYNESMIYLIDPADICITALTDRYKDIRHIILYNDEIHILRSDGSVIQLTDAYMWNALPQLVNEGLLIDCAKTIVKYHEFFDPCKSQNIFSSNCSKNLEILQYVTEHICKLGGNGHHDLKQQLRDLLCNYNLEQSSNTNLRPLSPSDNCDGSAQMITTATSKINISVKEDKRTSDNSIKINPFQTTSANLSSQESNENAIEINNITDISVTSTVHCSSLNTTSDFFRPYNNNSKPPNPKFYQDHLGIYRLSDHEESKSQDTNADDRDYCVSVIRQRIIKASPLNNSHNTFDLRSATLGNSQVKAKQQSDILKSDEVHQPQVMESSTGWTISGLSLFNKVKSISNFVEKSIRNQLPNTLDRSSSDFEIKVRPEEKDEIGGATSKLLNDDSNSKSDTNSSIVEQTTSEKIILKDERMPKVLDKEATLEITNGLMTPCNVYEISTKDSAISLHSRKLLAGIRKLTIGVGQRFN